MPGELQTSGGQHWLFDVHKPQLPLIHAWFPQSLQLPHMGGLPPELPELPAPLELPLPPSPGDPGGGPQSCPPTVARS